MALFSGAILSILAVSPAQAQSGSEYSLYNSINTFLGQGNILVNGSQRVKNNSCVPTSTANGLSFLEQYASSISIPDPFTSTPDTYATVNSLQTSMGTTAAGTTVAGQQAGVGSYLAANAPTVTYSSSSSTPTGNSLSGLLNANNAVQLGILWGTNSSSGTAFNGGMGGHFVSLVSMSLTGGSGFMTIMDPWGNDTTGAQGPPTPIAGTNATFQTLGINTVTYTAGANIGTYLYITYTNLDVLYVGPDDTTGDDGTTAYGAGTPMTGIIAVDTVEAVPEPGSIVLTGAAAVVALGFRIIRRRKDRW